MMNLQIGDQVSHKARKLTLGHGAPRWHILRVEPQQETTARKILGGFGVDTIVPMAEKMRRVNRYKNAKVAKRYPVLVGYVIAGFDSEPNWFEILSFRFVSGVIGVNGHPAEIKGRSQHELSQYLGNLEKRGVITARPEEAFMVSGREFEVGDTVEFIGGGFDMMQVEVSQIKGTQATIILDILGVARDVEVSLDCLAKIS